MFGYSIFFNFEFIMRAQKYRILFFLLTFIVHSFEGFSQKMNLEECIDHAIENNIQLKQAEINTQISEYSTLNSKYNLLPSVNGSAAWNNNYGRSVDPFTNQFTNDNVVSYNLSLNSQVTLFSGFSKINTIKQSQINYEKSIADLQKNKNDIILAVASGYLQVLMAKENMNSARLQSENTSEQLSRVQKQVDAGALTKSNLLEIKTQLANDEFNLVTSENQLEIARLNLAQLLDIDNESFDIKEPELDIENLKIDSYDEGNLYEMASQNMPEIKSAQLNVQSAKKGYQISKGNYSPTLTLSAVIFTGTSSVAQNPNFDQYQISGFRNDSIGVTSTGLGVFNRTPILIAPDYLIGDQLKDNIRQQLSLNLSIPIFNGMTTRTQVQRSKLNHQIAELEEQNSKNQLKKNIKQAYVDYKAAAKRYQSAKNQLEVSNENYKNAKIRFEQGLLSTTDYRTITNTQSSAESDLLNAKFDFVFKQKVLDFYQGKQIKL